MHPSAAFRCAVLGTLTTLLPAQEPTARLVVDADPTPRAISSDVHSGTYTSDPFLTLGGWIYFRANDPAVGRELFRANPNAGSVELVADINPGVFSSIPEGFVVAGGWLYFAATEPVHGREIWRTNGTTTERISDIVPGPGTAEPDEFTAFGNRVLFRADFPGLGREPGIIDGAQARILRDMRPGPDSSWPREWAVNADHSFAVCSVDDGTLGRELLVTDGTTAGTYVDDIHPSGSSHPLSFGRLGNEVLFRANDGVHGDELWATRGALGTTRLVADIDPAGNSRPIPHQGVQYHGSLYFIAQTAANGLELFRTDGSAGGTSLVVDLNPGSGWTYYSGLFLDPTDDVILGRADDEFFVSDGTAAGSRIVDLNPNGDSYPNRFLHAGGQTYVSLDAGNGLGRELYTIGAAAQPSLAADVFPGSEGGDPDFTAELNGHLLFVAQSPAGRELHGYEPSSSTVRLIDDIDPRISTSGSDPEDFITGVNLMFFEAGDPVHGDELWVTDGTTQGSRMVKDINPGRDRSGISLRSMGMLDDLLVFGARDGVHGVELWRSDGTAAGTFMIGDLNPTGESYPSNFTPFGSRMLFTADDGQHGNELWITDGTAAGTSMVTDLRPGASGSWPTTPFVLGERVFFKADDDAHGSELWVSDGTAAGTRLVLDINPSGNSNPGQFAALGDLLLFRAVEPATGDELWCSDGTAAGTHQVGDLRSGVVGSDPSGLCTVGSQVFFSAGDGFTGQELWVTDGTAAGTRMVIDLRAGNGSQPERLRAVGDRVVFSATTDFGEDLPFASDGTAAGTVRLADVRFRSRHMTVAGERLYFLGDDGYGEEPWVTDGTPAGTRRLGDFNPGEADFEPEDTVAFRGRILVSADDGVHGREVFAIENVGALTAEVGRSHGPGSPTLRSTAPVLGGNWSLDVTAPGNAVGVITVGRPGQAIATHAGCSIYTPPEVFVTLGFTSTRVTLPLPNVPTLRDQTFRFQAIWLGSTVSTSNGIDVTLGD